MIGALRERVTLLRAVRLPDGGGGAAIAYEPRETVWASAEDRPSVAERLAVRGARLRRRRFVVREDTEVSFETRLSHRGGTFRVTDIRRRGGRAPFRIVDAEEVR